MNRVPTKTSDKHIGRKLRAGMALVKSFVVLHQLIITEKLSAWRKCDLE